MVPGGKGRGGVRRGEGTTAAAATAAASVDPGVAPAAASAAAAAAERGFGLRPPGVGVNTGALSLRPAPLSPLPPLSLGVERPMRASRPNRGLDSFSLAIALAIASSCSRWCCRSRAFTDPTSPSCPPCEACPKADIRRCCGRSCPPSTRNTSVSSRVPPPCSCCVHCASANDVYASAAGAALRTVLPPVVLPLASAPTSAD